MRNIFNFGIALFVVLLTISLIYLAGIPNGYELDELEKTPNEMDRLTRGSIDENNFVDISGNIRFIQLTRKNYKAPLATAYQIDKQEKRLLNPPSRSWRLKFDDMQKGYFLKVFFKNEPALIYSIFDISTLGNKEIFLECPPLANIQYRFTELPEEENIKLIQKWRHSYKYPPFSDSVLPLPLESKIILSTTSDEKIYKTSIHIGSLNSIASASYGAFYPPNQENQIENNNIPSEITFKYSTGITLDIEFRANQSKEGYEPLAPPQLRSLRTNELFTSEMHDGENSFRFTGLPFENYEFVTKPGELFVPLDSYQLLECRNEKTIFKPETYYHAIRLCHIQLTPVRLILDNNWSSSELSFSMQPKQINGQMDSALSMGLPEKYKYFHGDFQNAVNNNSISVNMIPGRYKCALIALQRTERSEMEKIGYPPQQLSITVPKQDDWYEVRLKFPATGRIQGEIDTTYYDHYSVIVDPVKDNVKNNGKIQLIASDKVVKDKFIVPRVPVGVYRIRLTAPNVGTQLTSDSFQVEANKTTIVRFTTTIQDMNYFTCRIADFKGRPIRNMSVQLQQGSHASFGTSDENGNLMIPYRKNLELNADLMIRSSSGTIMPDDGGRQPIDIQADLGKEIRFEGLTRFRFLVLDVEEKPCRNYYIKFEHEDSGNLRPYIDTLIKDSEGWEEIEVVPKGETKIYGSILNEQHTGGLKFRPQYLMTHTIEDISNLQIVMTEPREYNLQFFDQRRQPIQNVSVPPLRKAFLTKTVELPNWIDRMKQIGYRTNHEGRINFMASGSKEESICLYYHDKYGLGYIRLPMNGPLEHEIYLMEPSTLSFDDVDFQLPAMHYLSIQVPSQINPFLFHIHLREKSLPDLKFQPKRWQMVITSTQGDFERNFDPSSLEELELPIGGTFTPYDIQKLRKSRFDK